MANRLTSASDAHGSQSPPQWKADQLLQLIHRFNSHCIGVIGRAVAEGDAWAVPAIVENRELWISLDDRARARAGQIQFLILDLRFNDDDWWQRAMTATAPTPAQSFAYPLAETLMEQTLLLATQIVSWDALAARMLLGMSPSVAEWMHGLHPHVLANIRRCYVAELQLRWRNEYRFWRDLLTAASDNDEKAMSACRMDARLLYGGDMFQVCK